MTTETITQGTEGHSKRRSAVLVGLALGVALAGVVAMAGMAKQADAAFTEKIVFTSNRTVGTGVNNPTGDYEIFSMNPDGTAVKQLTFNKVDDIDPILSPDGTKVAYTNEGIQTSNPEGDHEIYVMNTLDGTGKKNLTNNGSGVGDYSPVFSPNGKQIAYTSLGAQPSNPEGDSEVYRLNVLDGTGKKNLSRNTIYDYFPVFSPDGQKIAYTSRGGQPSNEEGDEEIYRMNALDGTGKKNLSNNGLGINDDFPVFSPDGKQIAYTSLGAQPSNPEGDSEVYRLNVLDGTIQKNLTNSDQYVNDSEPDFSPDGKQIAYTSRGMQTSNGEGDAEVYVMNALDGTVKKNLANNEVRDSLPDFSPDGTRVFYVSQGFQASNPEGDFEVYAMNAPDGSSQTNLTNNSATDGIYVKLVE